LTPKSRSNRSNAINNSACMNIHAHARTSFKSEKIISKILFQYVSFYSRSTLSSMFMAYTTLLHISVTQCIFYAIRPYRAHQINLEPEILRFDEPESEEYRGSDMLAKITICKFMNNDSSLLCLAFIGLSLSLKTNDWKQKEWLSTG
uniref:Ovule protein n=1 Tax=Brugia timori TaxID=42155 RepID=A0A0R3Q399_9BILA